MKLDVFNKLVLEKRTIEETMLKLDTNKGPGPDGISPVIIKNCASELSTPLNLLFNESLEKGKVPLAWKMTAVTPIHKSGPRDNIKNYRAISKQSCIPKILDKLVNEFLRNYILSSISYAQHGFMPNRSCATNLICHSTYIANSLSCQDIKQVDVVCTDFEKAFDRVKVNVLMKCLKSYGINGSLYDWLESYLCSRLQYVVVNGYKSDLFIVPSGVPQGSHCGPTLFNILLNMSCQSLTGINYQFYADDAKFSFKIRNIEDCIFLQTKFNSFVQWCHEYGLELNDRKCSTMTVSKSRSPINFDYSIGSNILTRINNFNDLGVIFDSKFSFNEDIERRVAKGRSLSGFLKRHTKEFRDETVSKSLFISLVRSNLEYCNIIWSPYYQETDKKIENVQKSFLKFMLNPTGIRLEYEEMCNHYGLQSLRTRRKITSIMMCFDILSGNLDCPEILAQLNFNCPVILLRRHSMFKLKKHTTNFGEHNPVNVMMRNFNEVQHLFDFGMNKNQFKKKVRDFFSQQ